MLFCGGSSCGNKARGSQSTLEHRFGRWYESKKGRIRKIIVVVDETEKILN